MANARTKKFKLPKQPQPRSMDEINQDFGRLVAQAGQAQYQVSVISDDLKRMNDQIRSLNYEAAARKELDEKNAKEQAKAQPTEVSDAAQG